MIAITPMSLILNPKGDVKCCRITMRPRFDMGRVHDGFHAALFHSDPEAGSLYSQLVETLLSADSSRQKPIFLTGKSSYWI